MGFASYFYFGHLYFKISFLVFMFDSFSYISHLCILCLIEFSV